MTVRIPPLTAAGLLALTAVNAWLLAVLLQDHGSMAQPVVAKSEWKPKSSGSTLGMPGPKPLTIYGSILAQPIFFKSRQPFVPPPPPPPLAPMAPAPAPVAVDPGLVFGGVIITAEVKKAYLFSKADPRGTWVSEGEIFMGWTVQSIHAASARLSQANRSIELHLYPPRPQP
jgi:hypothetical protein